MPVFRVKSSAIQRCEKFNRSTKIIFDTHPRKEKKVPSLISALTSHVEGSRAFTRYRTIDLDMKKDLVKILEGGK